MSDYILISDNILFLSYKASIAFGLSNIGIAGSNPARGMDVCLSSSVLCCSV
jgi:hypothetical protein